MQEHSFLFGPLNHLLTALLGPPPASRLSPAWRQFFFPNGPDVWLDDHVVMALFLFAVLAAVLPWARRRFRKESPNWFQNLNEMLVSAVRSLLDDVIGHGAADRYLPLIGTFAYFILLSNLMGFFFFLTPPTAALNTTLALALVSFTYYNVQGLRAHGLGGYLKHLAGPVWWLAILYYPLEIVSNLARILSLSLRLAGNIGGDHLAEAVFSGLSPILASWPLMVLGLLGAIIQTFIFVMLSIMYIYLATAHEEH